MRRIALATSEAYKTLTSDDQALLAPLTAKGFTPEPAIWSDQAFPWSSMDAVIIRSCWDYHLRLPEFLTWLSELEAANVKVWNAPALLRWNSDKTYLRELGSKDIPIIPTIWPEAAVPLQETLRSLGWEKAVVKPRVSATAYKTCLTAWDDTGAAQRVLEDLVRGSGALVQKFMPNIVARGEWSLIFFAGRYSHAVIKTPKDGDFRVQHDFGGIVHSAEPPAHVLQDAVRVIEAVSQTPLYARVDGVESGGRLHLMELELIEPALFLKSSPLAAGRFAAAIASSLQT